MKPTPCKRVLVACAAALLFSPGLSAQNQATDGSTPSSRDDEVVVLTPFTVNAENDKGYIAADTTIGGRLSMNLLKAPGDVTVLTREFLDDIGVTSVLEAANYLTSSTVAEVGVQTSSTAPENRDFGGNVSFRGLGNTTNTRDYFTYATSVNEYIVERLEGSRGSNAIVYGDGGAGGQLNIVTKRANFRNRSSVRVRTDSEGSLHTYVDINRAFSKKFAARVNLFWQDRKNWTDRYFDRGQGAALALTYHPWRGASYRFEGEISRLNRAPGRYVFRDQVSLWTGTTITAPLTSTPASSLGITRYTTDRVTMSPGLAGIVNFRNYGRTAGTQLSIVDEPRAEFGPTTPVVPRGFRINPDEERNLFDTYNAAFFLEQAFDSGLVFEIAGSASGVLRNNVAFPEYEWVYQDIVTTLPNGQPNPKFGQYFSESAYQESQVPEWFNNYRAAVAYPWKTKWFKHTFSAVAMRRDKFSDPRTYVYGRTKDPTNANLPTPVSNSSNTLWFRRYFDDPGAPLGITTGTPTIVTSDGYEFSRYATRHDRLFSRLDTLQAHFIGEYLDDQVTFIAGARQDDVTQLTRVGSLSGGVRIRDTYTLQEVRATSKNFGLSYFPKWFAAGGAYANLTDGFRPQGGNTNPWLRGTGPTVSPSRTYGYGIRLRLFDGVVVGSIGGYQSREKDALTQVSGVRDYINNLWTAIGDSDHLIQAPFNTLNDSIDRTGRGWEGDLTVNVSDRFRMKLNAAFPKAKQTNALPDIRSYFAENSPVWTAGRTPDNTAVIDTNMANIQNLITNTNDGRDLNGLYKWRANFFANYEIASGPLARMRLGLGANFFGRRLIGNAAGNAFDYIYAKEYVTMSASVNYTLRVRKTPIELSLYISNLLDYDEPVYLGTQVYQGVAIPSYYSYISPRMASLTATVRF